MSSRRLGIGIAAAALAAGLILALVPTQHTYPAGPRKDLGFVDEQTVSCGLLFAPKNPHVRGYDDECDAEHTGRGVLAVGVSLAGVLVGGLVLAGSMLRDTARRGSGSP